jgi:hypothetical protein
MNRAMPSPMPVIVIAKISDKTVSADRTGPCTAIERQRHNEIGRPDAAAAGRPHLPVPQMIRAGIASIATILVRMLISYNLNADVAIKTPVMLGRACSLDSLRMEMHRLTPKTVSLLHR